MYRRLLEGGVRLIGVDCTSDHYDASLKDRRNAKLLRFESYRFAEDMLKHLAC